MLKDVTMGDDACGEMMPPNKAIRTSKRQVHGVIQHMEKQFQKNFVPG
jgi:hypothetical protein